MKTLGGVTMSYRISFTAWYLNPDRICQLINAPDLAQSFQNLRGVRGIPSAFSDIGIARNIIKQRLEEWLHANAVPSLGELIIKRELFNVGALFTIYHDFYCKGLAKYNTMDRLPRDAVAEIYCKPAYDSNRKTRIIYSPHNLTATTAWSRLKGRSRLFCFCYIESITDDEIVSRPFFIGDTHGLLDLNSPDMWRSHNYGEIHIAEIDQFKKIRNVYSSERKAPQIEPLRHISEREIKQALAEIINESEVPNDWGGERSDLFTSNLSVEGEYMTSAFLLKGPAKFSEMKMIHLGKNGDQIDRLFSEPANLLILQHCHKVASSVRSAMRAYASRVNDLRYFSIIDGFDTVRLLRAYNKCGM